METWEKILGIVISTLTFIGGLLLILGLIILFGAIDTKSLIGWKPDNAAFVSMLSGVGILIVNLFIIMNSRLR